MAAFAHPIPFLGGHRQCAFSKQSKQSSVTQFAPPVSTVVTLPCVRRCLMNIPVQDAGSAATNSLGVGKISGQGELEQLRSAYKSAKSAYKTCKKETNKDMTQTARLMELEGVYVSAKAAYKTAKHENKQRMEMGTSSEASDVETAVLVCGGNACTKLGAQAVATLLLGRGAAPNCSCLKKCGGIGPTVCVDGHTAKVDLKQAVSEAVASVAAFKNATV